MTQKMRLLQQEQAMQSLRNLVRGRLLTPQERREIDNVYRDLCVAREVLWNSSHSVTVTYMPRADLLLAKMLDRFFQPGGKWFVVRLLRELFGG